MRSVVLQERFLDDYKGIVTDQTVNALREAAAPLEGKKVLHINSTSYGGGVAEILSSMVPLMRDLGMDAQWKVIEGDEEFFRITKTIHNGLQGGQVVLSEKMQNHYMEVNRRNAEDLEDGWDFVIVHDPQPAAILGLRAEELGRREGKWIWRCHIDMSTPNPDCLAFLSRFIPSYDASIFSLEGYIPPGIGLRRPVVIHPSIDPLTGKNRPMSPQEVELIAQRYGIDPSKPTVCAVARFDPWKDPLGVIDLYKFIKGQPGPRNRLPRLLRLYKAVKREVRDFQLLLVASMAHDDPEGWEYYEKALRRAGEDPDIFFLTNLRGVGGEEVNAFQRFSDVAVMRSIREGFGLTVSEALWKRVPVVGSRVGGIPLQVLDGETGFLTEDAQTAAERIIRLITDEGLRRRMGEAGRAHVKGRFLTTRHLRDYVDLMAGLSQLGPTE